MGRIPNQTVKGEKYGQWTVISNELKRHTNRSIYYNVVCSCGHEGWRSASLLKAGKTKACKSCCKTKNGDNTFLSGYFSRVRSRAILADLNFDIDIDYINDLFTKQEAKCKLSGIDIQFKKNWGKGEQTASLDRIDNKKGYIKGNVQWLHKDINNMKHTFSEDYFIDLCNKVSKCG